ncbi:MAG TPA: hypothetical protein QGI22_02560 [Candidatus Woesearchaeota archaeon]|jgi:hypothetical protein|nr:hypothetical protein [Candidatus Woesearchaeota archaeon]|tara:strand:+ start:22205 stop:23911 length:1707 start_codon:yes stop_codon:yes gene_type:complete
MKVKEQRNYLQEGHKKRRNKMENQEKTNKLSIIQLAEGFSYEVNRIIQTINKKDTLRLSAGKFLENEYELRKRLKFFQIGNIIRNENQKSNGDNLIFLNSLKSRLDEIHNYDQNIGQYVKKVNFDIEELSILKYLGKIVRYHKNNRPKLIKFFNNFGIQILGRLKLLDDTKISRDIQRLIVEINGEEIKYLTKYEYEIKSWPKQIGSRRVQFFSSMLAYYIYGTKNKRYDYKGILTYFNDKKLMGDIADKDILKRLLNFSHERKFFATILLKIKKGMEENNWKDFLKVWRERKENEKILKDRFGDKEFGSLFRKLIKNSGQDPQQWAKLISGMVSTLDNPNYINKEIIIPASEELSIIFKSRINDIRNNLHKSIGKLEDIIFKRIKEIENKSNNISKNIIQIIDKKERKRIKKIRRVFNKKEEELIERMENFSHLIGKLPNTFIFLKESDKLEKSNDYARKLSDWIKQLALRIKGKEIIPSGYILYLSSGLSILSRTKTSENRIAENIIHNLEFIQIKNIRNKVLKSYSRLNNLQDDLNSFLSVSGLIDVNKIENNIIQKRQNVSEVK